MCAKDKYVRKSVVLIHVQYLHSKVARAGSIVSHTSEVPASNIIQYNNYPEGFVRHQPS
jgi:hypothetical protein